MPITVILNLIAIYVLSRPAIKRTTNMSFLYRWSISINTSIVLAYIFIFNAPVLFNVDFYTSSNFSCKVIEFLRCFMLMVSLWFIVLISFDRFRLIHCPNKMTFMRSKQSLFSMIKTMLIGLAFVASPSLLFFVEESYQGKVFYNRTSSLSNLTETISINKYSRICTSTKMINLVCETITMVMKVYTPISLIFILNLVTAIDIYKSKNRVRSMLQHKEIQFTIAVINSNFTYLIVSMPLTVAVILKRVLAYSFSSFDYSKEWLEFFFKLSIHISCLYLIFEFFNLLIVNHAFRNELISVLKLTFKCVNMNKHQNSIDLVENELNQILSYRKSINRRVLV